MILSELHKVFIKQRLLLFFSVLLLLNYAYHILAGYDTTEVISNSESYYTSYFDKYEGKITEAKIDRIKAEYELIEKDAGNTLANKLEKQAFESFYHVFLYEKDSGSGYLSDTRGWETILCHDDINYFLVIFVVFLGVILFGTEYENEMDVMIVSTCGRNRLTKCKIVIGIAVGMIASIIFQIVHISYLIAAIGLNNSSYPLNTIEYFENTYYKITLGQALMMKIALNMAGSVMLVCFVMFLTVLLKKREISMVLSLLSVMLPTMIFSKGSTIYKIPWCSSLLSASGFLWPNRYTHKIIENRMEKIISFQAVVKSYLFGVLFVDIFLMILFLCVIFARFANYSIKSHRKIKSGIIAGILMCLCLTGCGRTTCNEEVSIDGTLNGQISVTKDIYVYYIDQDENLIYRGDVQNNTIAVTRNAFPLQQKITNIFVDNNNCYYLLESDYNSNITVHRVDLNSFEDVLIYGSGSDNTEDFYGLVHDQSEDINEVLKNITTVKWFFVTDDSIYYQKESVIYKCSLAGMKEEIIDSAVSDGEIRYQNGVLYYRDEYGDEACYSR